MNIHDLPAAASTLKTIAVGTLDDATITDIGYVLVIASDDAGGDERILAALAIAERLMDELKALRAASQS